MSKPGAMSLSADSARYVYAQRGFFYNAMKLYLPVSVILFLMKIYFHEQQMFYAELALIVPVVLLYALYALAWHRHCLMDEDTGSELSLVPKRKDFEFLMLFLIVIAFFTMATKSVGLMLEQALLFKGTMAGMMFAIGSPLFMFCAFYMFLKVSFALPAQSVGVSLSWKEILSSSKGMVWPLFGANLIFAMIVFILVLTYLMMLGLIAGMTIGQEKMEPLSFFFISALSYTPLSAFILFMTAMSVTSLSRAYRWGIENNQV